jgi:hypothetical protein
MNSGIQIVIGYVSAAVTFAAVATVAGRVDWPTAPGAAGVTVPASDVVNDGQFFIEMNRQRIMHESWRQHWQQMDWIRNRTW